MNFFSDEINWKELKQTLASVDWNRLFMKCDPCDMMETFLFKCLEISKLYVPLKRLINLGRSQVKSLDIAKNS